MESQRNLEDATDQGHRALSHYRKHGERRDLEHSISQFERALSICPPDHPCHVVALSNLAMARFIHCQIGDTAASLEIPLRLYRSALAARPVGHTDRPSTLIQLAMVHFARGQTQGNDVETGRAEVLLREAMHLTHTNSQEMKVTTFLFQVYARLGADPAQVNGQLSIEQDLAACLTDEDLPNLSIELLERFERFGALADLQQAIVVLENLVRSTSVLDHQHRRGLATLGVALWYRFKHLGDLNDIEEAISTLKHAIQLFSRGHLARPGHLNNLGGSLLSRFECLGELNDVEDAIKVFRDAIVLVPHDDSDKPTYLTNLGNCLIARFERLGELGDLEDAVSGYRTAVVLTPRSHPRQHSYLANLGSSLQTRFEHLGELNDLETAISRQMDAVELTPRDHPRRPTHLDNLGISLYTRFMCLGELDDLADAISRQRDAIDLVPNSHPDKPSHLTNLGNSFSARFARLGELSDLEDAILALRNAVDLTPHDHIKKPTRLNNLGCALLARFECLGELGDLEDAISRERSAVDLTPYGHPAKHIRLNNLGRCLQVRFQNLGELSDIVTAISILKNAVDLTHGHPSQPYCLNNLGNTLMVRFRHLKELSDLTDAIFAFRGAVDLTPNNHPHKLYALNSLGLSLMIGSRYLGELSDLEEAVSCLRELVDLTPHGHPRKPAYLGSLGTSFLTRFERLGELNDLEAAISRYTDSLELIPDGHPDKALYLRNIGDSFYTRFKHLGEPDDLEIAVLMQKAAIGLTPHNHPDLSGMLSDLGDSFFARFEHLGEPSDPEQAISLYSRAARFLFGDVSARFSASQNWISCAQRTRHHSLLHAYSVAISLLPQIAWIGLSLSQRYVALTRGANMVQEAAAAALDSGLLETAVEWLEQGRSIVWGDLLRLRDSYKELSSAHPDHALRLRELSTALEHASATREVPLSGFNVRTEREMHRTSRLLEKQAEEHHTLALERDKLLQEVRKLPGFERFLLHKEFSQLRASAHSGPVVMLNAAENRCDALIILSNVDHVIHVPLPNFNFKRSAGLQKMLDKLLGHARSDERKGEPTTQGRISWESLLSTLWNDVVKPVLDALAFSVCIISSVVVRSGRSSVSLNRLWMTSRASFGVRLVLSCFFLFMQLVYMVPSIHNLETKCPTLSFHHTSLPPASLGSRRPISARQLTTFCVCLLFVSHSQMAYPDFQV